ncbi:MAG TPA: WhiB family transcriptional regulator [Acidimicrobiales bacterium]|nr:WhiB family transcriptional regulator [Acidimicrobiales bacterium]
MRDGPVAGNEHSWRDEARCLGSDPDLFFPLGSKGKPLEQAEVAKGLCLGCQVRGLCLQYALETNQVTGVWGGTTEDERRSLRRKWVRAGRPAQPA